MLQALRRFYLKHQHIYKYIYIVYICVYIEVPNPLNFYRVYSHWRLATYFIEFLDTFFTCLVEIFQLSHPC